MLDRLREWWNRPDPLVRHIMWQYEYIMEWVDKWCQKNKWSRVWKQTAKKWRRKCHNAAGDLENARRSAWSWKKAADRRRELLKEALVVLAEADPGWPIVEPVYRKIEKELADED